MLESHFGQFGTITDAVVMEMNGQPRGFGFVTYEAPEMVPSLHCSFALSEPSKRASDLDTHTKGYTPGFMFALRGWPVGCLFYGWKCVRDA